MTKLFLLNFGAMFKHMKFILCIKMYSETQIPKGQVICMWSCYHLGSFSWINYLKKYGLLWYRQIWIVLKGKWNLLYMAVIILSFMPNLQVFTTGKKKNCLYITYFDIDKGELS